MAGLKLSGSGSQRAPRGPRHSWTIDQKRCLLCLFTSLELSESEAVSAFNRIYRGEIDASNFPNGLPVDTVKAQFREHKRKDNMSWQQILKPRLWETESRLRNELAARIRQVLDSHGDHSFASFQAGSGVQSSTPTDSRKRRQVTLEDYRHRIPEAMAEESDTIAVTTPQRRVSMVVVPLSEGRDRIAHARIDEVDEESQFPQTPRKKAKIQKAVVADTVRVIRNSGPVLSVSRKVQAEIQEGYSPPSEQEAHPSIGSLFYRFWDADQSQGLNSANGFIAKRYVRSNAVPARAPPAKYLDPTDLWNHLNEEKESTPFVSVSDSLVWSLSKLLKLVKGGKWRSAKLSVIDGKKLSQSSVFHAAGFYRQLSKIRPFTNGAHRGVSSHEYLIWRDIPEAAMIKTINARDFVAAVAGSKSLCALLRLDVLQAAGGYQTDIRSRLQKGGVAVTDKTAVAMARLAQHLGLCHVSPLEHHRHLVNDIVSSYKMAVPYHSDDEWRNIAAHYTHTICRESRSPVPAKTQALIKLAFLEGVRLGASFDFRRYKLAAKPIQSVQRKARSIGLEDPARVIAGEADAVKVHVVLEQKREWKVFERPPSQMLLAEEDGVDEGSVFEFDDDGLVV